MSTLRAPEELTLEDLFASVAVEGESGEEENGEVTNPVLPTVPEIIWAAVFFFALWAVMRYVLLPPLQKTRAERARRIAEASDAADQASSDRSAVQAEYDAALAAARQQAAAVIDAARAEADAYRQQVLEAAQADVEASRQRAAAELAEARTTALALLRDDVTAVAVGAASTVLGQGLDPAAQTATVSRVLEGRREGTDR